MRTVDTVLVNEDKGYRFSEFSEDIEEDVTNGEVFRNSLLLYGRCASSVYFDPRRKVGWYFVKRAKYEDSSDTYLQGSWVMIRDDKKES